MKSFFIANWYKVIVSFSLFIFSSAFFIFVLKNNKANAGALLKSTHQEDVYIVANARNVYEVKRGYDGAYTIELVGSIR